MVAVVAASLRTCVSRPRPAETQSRRRLAIRDHTKRINEMTQTSLANQVLVSRTALKPSNPARRAINKNAIDHVSFVPRFEDSA